MEKPSKPYSDYPLFPHASGRWAKKIRGKLVYFGKWEIGWKNALDLYLDQRDDLHGGRDPHPYGLVIADLVNAFLTAKKRLLKSGDIVQRTWDDYYDTGERIVDHFGKTGTVESLRPEDFDEFRQALAKRFGPVALGNEINRVRIIMKYGTDAGLLDKPVLFGPHFKRPSSKVLRLHRKKAGPKMFSAEEIRTLIAAADPQLATMILLGINAGLGNQDCGELRERHLDLRAGWMDYERPKTGIERRARLWDETVLALHTVIETKREPLSDDNAELVFVTKYGHSWSKESRDNPISKQFRKVMDDVGIVRPGVGFYALRHTFATIAGESRDQPAVDYIMGHVDPSMAARYRESISDERLSDVATVVYAWLDPSGKLGKKVSERVSAADS